MLRVSSPGLLTTVQDLGRPATRHLGVPTGGALDAFSLRVANSLVRNPDGAPALEVTWNGPTLRFERAGVVALAGALPEAWLNDVPVAPYRPLRVEPGDELKIGRVNAGARSYLAVRGGFTGNVVFGSASTELRAGFGGHEGRALRRGDALTWREEPLETPPRLHLHASLRRVVGRATRVRFLPEAPLADLLVESSWRVSATSDRTGLRLDGPSFSSPPAAGPSEPVVPGLLQCPPDGVPIALLADSGTHGGYARFGVVARVDLPRLGQLRPGDAVRFEPVSLDAAVAALREEERVLRGLRRAVEWAYAATSRT
ncbi:biotin-dependent carboxyltransferase family protein [Deinococcus yavapaiensis]|uniref:Antagonist of KipI n=1 Tax=Deinococcus yavapaiensis KR-236 TaxID=694435 RepID=A0A318S826_9DEIO|nr:biotin-dependent carboxyltransferase family protein [Deinococcus yavapaiensis]PYE51931.1 antagonist of KipI [Deinococcus yavapaiensis KR-236]